MVSDRDRGFRLEVPLDASGINDEKTGRVVKVAAFDRDGCACNATVAFDPGGYATATLLLSDPPGDLRVVVGPENASTTLLRAIQSLCVEVSARQWNDNRTLRLPPVPISGFHWWWWLAPPLVRNDPFLE
jgi:hypothetical protein